MSDNHCPQCWAKGQSACYRSDCPRGAIRKVVASMEPTHGDSARRLSPRYPTAAEAERRRRASNLWTSAIISAIVSGFAVFALASDRAVSTWGLTVATTAIVAGALFSLAIALRRPS